MGKIEEGVGELRAAASLEPNSEPVRTNLAIALLKQGLYREAVDELRAALAIDRYSRRARLALAFALDEAGKFVLA